MQGLPVEARPRERRCDVVVVGAGFAGLRAALSLHQRGRSVIVVEARERVGGRAHTVHLDDGTAVDLGGQWVGPTQRRVLATAAEVGAPTFRMHDEGANLLVDGARTKRYRGSIPRGVGVYALANVGVAMLRLERMAKTVPLDAPWRAAGAERLDAQSLGAWVDRNVWSQSARRLLRIASLAIWGCEPSELSLLHALFYMHAAGGLDALISSDGGAQQDRFVEGAQSVAQRMAARLAADAVELSQPVRRIVQHEDAVVVRCDALVVSARRAIVAVPPTLAGRIDYDPPLPAARDQLTQRMPQGSMIKCFAVYDAPFWRARGLSGHATDTSGLVGAMFDASPFDARCGVLLGFVGGADARRWAPRDQAERRAAVLDSFAAAFGEQARQPRHYVDMDWTAEPFTRGCPVGVMPPGVMTACGAALRQRVGRIHWAGTETATEWNGYFDGAIQSGQRAAGEVDDALG